MSFFHRLRQRSCRFANSFSSAISAVLMMACAKVVRTTRANGEKALTSRSTSAMSAATTTPERMGSARRCRNSKPVLRKRYQHSFSQAQPMGLTTASAYSIPRVFAHFAAPLSVTGAVQSQATRDQGKKGRTRQMNSSERQHRRHIQVDIPKVVPRNLALFAEPRQPHSLPSSRNNSRSPPAEEHTSPSDTPHTILAPSDPLPRATPPPPPASY